MRDPNKHYVIVARPQVEDYLRREVYPSWTAKGSPWQRVREWLQRTLGWP